ncbi:hypothetical protein DEU56DRAFT_803351 [Suillus clintonianus]|uniref:uncharacterized protein n=1 Tax=Suillus clintonianus TaxID=1904413 RepID=UPI001B86C06A|nr:uncharacterized protein DEU56DRAFT_803351 [Suillus clintonianus]KAG2137964.1 hypothetical protein DEU56DRAFT_803351 [Suillus clintonianus]
MSVYSMLVLFLSLCLLRLPQIRAQPPSCCRRGHRTYSDSKGPQRQANTYCSRAAQPTHVIIWGFRCTPAHQDHRES